MAYFQGTFKPQNPKKYVGNVKNIQYRSGWEFMYMRNLDKDPDVINWNSEELIIPYYSPVDKKMHRYFPDFVVKKKTSTGTKVFVIEIKPMHQTKKPKQSKNRKKMITEATTFAINDAKWAAAREYCARHKMEFVVLTEKELKIK